MTEVVSRGLEPEQVTGESARSLGLGLLAGFLSGLPALLRALRLETPQNPLVLIGVCALPMLLLGPLVLALRLLRLPHVALPEERVRPSPLSELGATLLFALGPLALFGSWLERSTHHRPLGAVTFACVGLGILAVAFVVAQRLLRSGRRPLVITGLALAAALSAVVLLRGSVAGFVASPFWWDGVGLFVWTLLAVWGLPVVHGGAARRFPERWGSPARVFKGMLLIWAMVAVVGSAAIVLLPDEVRAVAPVFGWWIS